MVEVLVTVVTAAVGLLLLVVLLVALARHVRRFTRERAALSDSLRTGFAQLGALTYVRGKRHPHGVDSDDAT
jgi:hypothetical protein